MLHHGSQLGLFAFLILPFPHFLRFLDIFLSLALDSFVLVKCPVWWKEMVLCALTVRLCVGENGLPGSIGGGHSRDDGNDGCLGHARGSCFTVPGPFTCLICMSPKEKEYYWAYRSFTCLVEIFRSVWSAILCQSIIGVSGNLIYPSFDDIVSQAGWCMG